MATVAFPKGIYNGGSYTRRQGSIPGRYGLIPFDAGILAGIDANWVAERLVCFLFMWPLLTSAAINLHEKNKIC